MMAFEAGLILGSKVIISKQDAVRSLEGPPCMRVCLARGPLALAERASATPSTVAGSRP
jgi:hypothetical protein